MFSERRMGISQQCCERSSVRLSLTPRAVYRAKVKTPFELVASSMRALGPKQKAACRS